MDEYEVGYGKPPKEHQWKPGETGNAGGMTSEQRRVIQDNADKAIKAQAMLLDGVLAKLEMLSPEAREEVLRADVNRIIADAIDRHLGKPVARNEISDPTGSLTPPSVVQIVPVTAKGSAEG